MSTVMKTQPLILITDLNDVPLREIDLGELIMNNDSFVFRVWNNKDQKPGLPAATGLSLELRAPPSASHNLLLSYPDVIRGRCLFSAKLGGPFGHAFMPFPVQGEAFDTIPGGMFNEYEVILNDGSISNLQRIVYRNKLQSMFIVAHATRGS
jgi:hypothetical protein